MAALPENHPLALKKSLIYIQDLVQETFLMIPRSAGTLYFDIYTDLFRRAGSTPKSIIQAHDLQTVFALVSAGMGWELH